MQTQAVQEKLSEARTALAPWTEKMAAIRNARNIDATELKLLSDNASSAQRRLDDVTAELTSTVARLDGAGGAVATVRSDIDHHAAAQKAAEDGLRGGERQGKELEERVNAARAEAQQLRHAMDSEKKSGAQLKALMEAQGSGKLSVRCPPPVTPFLLRPCERVHYHDAPCYSGGVVVQGLHGRLGDLGAIDKKYDAAASNAGGGLDFLVVDTVTQGQKVLEYLRKYNLGVASLVILEKQGGHARQMQQPFTPPQGCERLFDLIQCDDDRVRSAFYWFARDTLVCRDMQQARQVAYAPGQKRRVVTLQVRRCPQFLALRLCDRKPRRCCDMQEQLMLSRGTKVARL